jgi:hypothetical protein
MVEHLFGVDDLNHGDDFLRKATAGTQRVTRLPLKQPSKPTRVHSKNAGYKWFGQNLSRNGGDDINPFNHRFSLCDNSALAPITIKPGNIRDDSSTQLPETLYCQLDEPPAAPRLLGESQIIPPALNSDSTSSPIFIQGYNAVCYPTDKLKGNPTINMRTIEGTNNLVTPETSPMAATVEEVTVTNLDGSIHYADHLTTGYSITEPEGLIMISHTRRMKKKRQSSRALWQFELLRRGFYPERDVIKWYRLERLSSEAYPNNIQEHLMSLCKTIRRRKVNSACAETANLCESFWLRMIRFTSIYQRTIWTARYNCRVNPSEAFRY